ncbi:hypothetical protein AMJ52_01825 [candidate division TA06 bacterium DG_78]|uniref:Uncharacterized protein n=1 Tax=candidate division TA06 bacterium DG_78 TaxID=1703772 RepID=A0A0S7YH98_UNCT6|nr:MAG: hypothetical protein AMJ52_01825 [candidate division TA06 bacterium DG_78]
MYPSFYFKSNFHLVTLLGLKAKDPVELLEKIKKVPRASIYYHTHRFLQQHHYLSPEPPNDFAYWLINVLNLKDLGELFAGVDTVSFRNMESLRAEFIKILETYLSRSGRIAECAEYHEFHFISCLTFILPTPYVAHSVKEFRGILSKISINSLYFHMFEARMRLERDENDFSAWFKSIGKNDLARTISKLDPYTITLEGLRKKIIETVSKYD